MRFNRLTALYATEKRTANGSVVWRCRCDCGNFYEASYNELKYTNLQSCGCKKKEHDTKLNENLIFVDGTSINHLHVKTPSNNTSGKKGVYFIKGKWVAKIVFQKKAYYLGTYDNFDKAAEARDRAENTLNDSTTAYYKEWKMKADIDEEWAERNPIRINVSRSAEGLKIIFTPNLKND